MKLHPEDPRLTAYLLGELPADEAAAVERAVAADPSLKMALADLERIQHLLANSLVPGKSTLLPHQRERILSAARHADESAKIITLSPRCRSPLQFLFISIASAAVIALAFFLLFHRPANQELDAANPPPSESDLSNTLPMEVALLPAPGPSDISSVAVSSARPTPPPKLAKIAAFRSAALQQDGDLFLRKVAERLSQSPIPKDSELPRLITRGYVNAGQSPTLALPIQTGSASLSWITRSIRDDGKRPPPDAVRFEEILNRFSLRPAGAAAIAQGVTLSTESLPCPWKPSATLLLVSLRGTSDAAREVTATFMANPANVHRYRLLGFDPVSGLPSCPLPSRLPAKAITSLVIEIESSNATGDLGSIAWTVNGQTAASVSIVRRSDIEPSDDARFSALVCTYSQWLAGTSIDLIDTDLLAALARETASDNLPADRLDFLNLIDQSLQL